jgi:hypothetical protein
LFILINITKPNKIPSSKPSQAELPTSKPSQESTGNPTRSPSRCPSQTPSMHPSINSAPSEILPSETPTISMPSSNPTAAKTTLSPTMKRYQVVTTKCSCTYPFKGITQQQLDSQFDAIIDIWTKAISANISDENWKVRISKVAGRTVRKVRLLSVKRFLQDDIIDVEVELSKVTVCLSDDGCTNDDVIQSQQEGSNVLTNVVESVESGTLVQKIQEEATASGLSDTFSSLSVDEVLTEEPQTEIIDPTPFPSTDVSLSPSASPTTTYHNYWCDDSPFRFKVQVRGETKTKSCVWVARHPDWKCKLEGVSSHCRSTCEVCRWCSDSTVRFDIGDYPGITNSTMKTCAWVARKATDSRCAIPGVASTCRSTCGTCCMDSSDAFTFTYNDNVVTKPCDWAARFNTNERCQVPEVSFHCPMTCGICCMDSSDAFTFTYNDNEVTKPCEWAARFNTNERCQVPEVSLNCPMTCGICCMDSPVAFTFTLDGKELTKPCEWAARFNTEERCQAPEVSLNCPMTCGTC